MHLYKKPKTILAGSKKIPFQNASKFEKEIGANKGISWSWDDEKKICKIKLSNSVDVNLSIIIRNGF